MSEPESISPLDGLLAILEQRLADNCAKQKELQGEERLLRSAINDANASKTTLSLLTESLAALHMEHPLLPAPVVEAGPTVSGEESEGEPLMASGHQPSDHARRVITAGIRLVLSGNTTFGPTALYREAGYNLDDRETLETVLPGCASPTKLLQKDIMPSTGGSKYTRTDLAEEISWLKNLTAEQRAAEQELLTGFGLINDEAWEALDEIIARLSLEPMLAE